MKKQRGRNNKYPETIETWRLGEKVPSWLSNVCAVKRVDESGEMKLDLREAGNGYELIASGVNQILVKVDKNEDYVCFGDSRIFSLTSKQIELLYD